MCGEEQANVNKELYFLSDVFSSSPVFAAITGGGGKTSLMYALARALQRQGKRTVTTTSTNIRIPLPQQSPALVAGCWPGCRCALEAALDRHGAITWVAEALREDKLKGDTPEAIESLFFSGIADAVLVEADGARGLSCKGYASHEPVVPKAVGHHFVVVGADVLGKSLSDENTFRLERIEAFRGESGLTLDIEALVGLLDSDVMYLKNSPASAWRELVINKAELLDPAGRAFWAQSLAARLCNYDKVSLLSLQNSLSYEVLPLPGLRRVKNNFHNYRT